MYKNLMLIGDRIAQRENVSRTDSAYPSEPKRPTRKQARREALSDLEAFLRGGGFSG